MGFVTSSMKCFLIFVNLIMMILGFLTVIIGSIALSKIKNMHHDIVEVETGPTIFILVIGVGIVFVTLLGICGVIKENNVMLMSFGTLVFLFFVIEVVFSGLIFGGLGRFEGLSKSAFKEIIKNYPNEPSLRDSLDEIQSTLECCGGTGYEDWWGEYLPIPSSCCGKDLVSRTCKSSEAYKQGCIGAIKETIGKCMKVLAIVGMIFGGFLLVNALISCGLARMIRNQQIV